MFILGCICARGGSKGIPHKNIKPLAGKPLMAYTIECAVKARAFRELVVSTDDEAIAAIAGEYGVPVLPRPPYLATDTASKWDVFRHIASQLEPDVLVDLDVGCPMREPEDIMGCIKLLRNGDADVVATAYEAERNPYFNMVEGGNERGGWHVIGDNYLGITRRQDAPLVYSLSPSVFAIRARALDLYPHWSLSLLQLHIIPRARALDIDTLDDFEYAEWKMSRKD